VPLVDLSQHERNLVGQCLRALADGPFIPDWEIHTLTGLTREEIREVARRWPRVDEAAERDRQAIHAALSIMTYGPIRNYDRWPHYISARHAEIEQIARKWWRQSPPASFLDLLRRRIAPPGS
jgi:hypothetical protein